MNSTKLKNKWASKHSTGFCGVGKMLLGININPNPIAPDAFNLKKLLSMHYNARTLLTVCFEIKKYITSTNGCYNIYIYIYITQ